MTRSPNSSIAAWRFPVATLLLAGAAIAASFSLPLARGLEYDRSLVAGGELWRVLTGHLVHSTAQHLGWDLAVFVALGAVIERTSRRGFLAIVLASTVAISAVVYLVRPDVDVYRGLSGVDSALFAWMLARLGREAIVARSKSLIALVASLGMVVVGKLIYETVSGHALFVTGGPANETLVIAHVAGFATGFGAQTSSRWRRPSRAGAASRCGSRGSRFEPGRAVAAISAQSRS